MAGVSAGRRGQPVRNLSVESHPRSAAVQRQQVGELAWQGPYHSRQAWAVPGRLPGVQLGWADSPPAVALVLSSAEPRQELASALHPEGWPAQWAWRVAFHSLQPAVSQQGLRRQQHGL